MVTRVLFACVLGIGGLQVSNAAFQHHTITHTNGQLHVVETGSGSPAVVFLPSLAGTYDQFAGAARAVSGKHRAVIVELRGHGQSTPPRDGNYSIDGYAADVAAVLAARQISDSILVGHSMGAGVALAYAAAHPKNVRAVLLVDPVDDPSRRLEGDTTAFLQALENDYRTNIRAYWTTILKGASREVSRDVLAALDQTPRATLIESMKAMHRFEGLKKIEQYGGPITSIISELNNFPTSLHVLAPAIRVHRMDGVSHWLQLDRPDQFNSLLTDFVRQHSSP